MLPFLPEPIEQWPIARLVPYARNARIHAEDQVAKIAASLVEYGWTAPVLVADDSHGVAVPRPDFGFRRRTIRPQSDPINAMLSFGYAMLFGNCCISIIIILIRTQA